jgi:hypothetical protein
MVTRRRIVKGRFTGRPPESTTDELNLGDAVLADDELQSVRYRRARFDSDHSTRRADPAGSQQSVVADVRANIHDAHPRPEIMAYGASFPSLVRSEVNHPLDVFRQV